MIDPTPNERAALAHGGAMAGEYLDGGADTCVVSMLAWRSAAWDDTRWQALVEAHEAEILQLKDLIEAFV